MKEPKIRQTILPPAPYPRTPIYRQRIVEVPADAKVIKVTEADYQPKKRTRKVRTQPKVIPSRDRKLDRKELLPREIDRAVMMYETGYTKKEIAYALKCKYALVDDAIEMAKQEGRI